MHVYMFHTYRHICVPDDKSKAEWSAILYDATWHTNSYPYAPHLSKFIYPDCGRPPCSALPIDTPNPDRAVGDECDYGQVYTWLRKSVARACPRPGVGIRQQGWESDGVDRQRLQRRQQGGGQVRLPRTLAPTQQHACLLCTAGCQLSHCTFCTCNTHDPLLQSRVLHELAV